jgi:hypothetical protein
VSPISTPPRDSLIGKPPAKSSAAPPTEAASERPEASGVNWLLTWLGQTQSSLEAEGEESPEAQEVASSAQQVQWLTLLPSVATNASTLEQTDDVQPMIATPVEPAVPIGLGPAEPSVGPDIVTLPGERSASLTQQLPGPADAATRQQAMQSDKGELIWAAELVVAEATTGPAGTEETSLSAETLPALRGEKASVAGSDMRQGGFDSEHRESAPEGQGQERAHSGSLSPAPQGNTHVELGPVEAAVEANGPPAIGSVELDKARPLRPAQIATLYVDVPASASATDAATMRLAITQRGDQLNVRLRSWDATTAPLDGDRMQPLLQSLAEQGYAAAKKSIERLDESNPMPIEHLREKPLAASESANTGNEQQTFQNPDDRQRKNQERQQQAFLLRRQPRNATTEQFDLQAQLEGVSSSQQKGAFR